MVKKFKVKKIFEVPYEHSEAEKRFFRGQTNFDPPGLLSHKPIISTCTAVLSRKCCILDFQSSLPQNTLKSAFFKFFNRGKMIRVEQFRSVKHIFCM